MRVSDSMFNDLAVANLTARRAEQFDAQKVAQTGLEVEKPSDDPVAAAGARGARSQERRADAVYRVAGDALDRLEAVDGVLGEANGVITRAFELATLGANDTLSASDRATLAQEVSVLRDQLLALANTEIDGEHIFGGLATDRDPFDSDGAFVGSTTLREMEVGPGVRVSTMLSGQEAFDSGVNAFAVLDQLEERLLADDGPGVHDLIGSIQAAGEQVAHVRSAGGATQRSLLQARAVAERTRDEAINRRSNLVEANPVEAFTELVRAQGALQQALAIAQQLPPPSLLGGR